MALPNCATALFTKRWVMTTLPQMYTSTAYVHGRGVFTHTHTSAPHVHLCRTRTSLPQVLAVALLSGKMHYCAEQGGDYIDPYYVLPTGETLTKDW